MILRWALIRMKTTFCKQSFILVSQCNINRIESTISFLLALQRALTVISKKAPYTNTSSTREINKSRDKSSCSRKVENHTQIRYIIINRSIISKKFIKSRRVIISKCIITMHHVHSFVLGLTD